jgi:hypothetical protein
MNNSMKNADLMAIPAVAEAIKAGSVVLIDKKQTADATYTNLYFFAETELGGGSGEVSEAAAMLLGWTGSQSRAIQNAKTEIANNFEVGKVFPDFALRCIDSVEKQWDTQNPRIDSNGQLFFNGAKEIYRRFELVTKSELAAKGHVLLEVTSKGIPAPAEQSQGVSANNILEKAQ